MARWRKREKMKGEIILRIIEFGDGSWRFDIKRGMKDDEIWKLIGRMKYVENELKGLMKTDLIKATETIQFLKDKTAKK